MNKTAVLVGAMIIFVVANVFLLSFVMNRSQQNVAQPLASTGSATTQPDATASNDGAGGTTAAASADPVAFKNAMDIGRVEFATCAACHGPDGRGLMVGPQKMAPTLVGSQIAVGEPDRAALVVLKGIKKESADYVGLMAPLPIDDVKLAGVLTFVRNSFGNNASLVTPEEVAAARTRFASVPPLLSRTGIDSLIAATPKVEVPAATGPMTATPSTVVTAAELPPVVKEPWVPIPGIKVVGGRVPRQRPEAAPLVSSMPKEPNWYRRATQGIAGPYPDSLQFLEDQGEWYTPFTRPGMTGPYDIRNWHIDD